MVAVVSPSSHGDAVYDSPSCLERASPMCADGWTFDGGSVKRSSVRPSFALTRASIPSGPIVVDHELKQRLHANADT